MKQVTLLAVFVAAMALTPSTMGQEGKKFWGGFGYVVFFGDEEDPARIVVRNKATGGFAEYVLTEIKGFSQVLDGTTTISVRKLGDKGTPSITRFRRVAGEGTLAEETRVIKIKEHRRVYWVAVDRSTATIWVVLPAAVTLK